MRLIHRDLNHFFMLILGFSLILLVGCVASGVDKLKTDMAAKGIAPLSASELKATFSDVTGTGHKDDWNYSRYTGPDGSVKIRLWGSNFERQDTGEWRVTDDGLMCIKYHGHFAKSGERCNIVYPGNSENEFITAIVSGKKSRRNPSGMLTHALTPGDSSGVQ